MSAPVTPASTTVHVKISSMIIYVTAGLVILAKAVKQVIILHVMDIYHLLYYKYYTSKGNKYIVLVLYIIVSEGVMTGNAIMLKL